MPCKFTGCCCWKLWRRRGDSEEDDVKVAEKSSSAKVKHAAKVVGEEAKIKCDELKVKCEEVKVDRDDSKVRYVEVKVRNEDFKVRCVDFKVKDEFVSKSEDGIKVANDSNEVKGVQVEENVSSDKEDSVKVEDVREVQDNNVNEEMEEEGGSSPGNPRNKCALQPGHSLMDWIRLGASGKDLTGVGPKAGHLSVTKQELSQHNKEDDAWLAIRGKVYNVTAYLPFHPGGREELMKGAGIDATKLFDQIHPWVNYDQILQKCFIGRLVSFDPSTDVETLFFGNKTTPPPKTDTNNSIKTPEDQKEPSNLNFLPSTSAFKEPKVKFLEKYPPKVDTTTQEDLTDVGPVLPRFDWIQTSRRINIIFYTNAFSNPLIEVLPVDPERTLTVILTYDETIFTNEIVLWDKVTWPCSIHVSYETGKVELDFTKSEAKIWEDCGVLKQKCTPVGTTINCCAKFNFVFCEKKQVTHNIFLIRLERTDGGRIVVPIGRHIRAFGNCQGQEMSRSYTPIPRSFFTQFVTQGPTTDSICLMIKRYENGNVSRFLADSEYNDVIHGTKPIGDFDLKMLQPREIFLFLAAGTGITPMLSVIQFLLERRIRKCQFARLLFFNKTEDDIPFQEQFEKFKEVDDRLYVTHILSEPSKDWKGLSGHVNRQMIDNAIQEHIRDTGYTIGDVFAFVCGPTAFTSLSVDELKSIEITEEQIHAFQG